MRKSLLVGQGWRKRLLQQPRQNSNNSNRPVAWATTTMRCSAVIHCYQLDCSNQYLFTAMITCIYWQAMGSWMTFCIKCLNHFPAQSKCGRLWPHGFSCGNRPKVTIATLANCLMPRLWQVLRKLELSNAQLQRCSASTSSCSTFCKWCL